MNRQRRKHSLEFKREAVALVTEHGYSYADAGRSLDVNANLIARWKQEFENNAAGAFPGKGNRTAEQRSLQTVRSFFSPKASDVRGFPSALSEPAPIFGSVSAPGKRPPQSGCYVSLSLIDEITFR